MRLRSGKSLSQRSCCGSKRSPIEQPPVRRPKLKLTRKNLRDLTRELAMSPRGRQTTNDPSCSSKKTSTTTTTDKNFPLRLEEVNIHYGSNTTPPVDIEELKVSLARRRDSESSDANAFMHYRDKVDNAVNELTMQTYTWPLLSKNPDASRVPGYDALYNDEWLESDNPFIHQGLSHPKPDISETLPLAKYPIDARRALEGSLDVTGRHAIPNFAVEYKSYQGNMFQARCQSAYYGATMTEAHRQIREHMSQPLDGFYGRTQAITVATNGYSVSIYANHAIEDNAGITYHQSPLADINTLGSSDAFNSARRFIRNAQDWARNRAVQIRDDLIAYHKSPKVQWVWDPRADRYILVESK